MHAFELAVSYCTAKCFGNQDHPLSVQIKLSSSDLFTLQCKVQWSIMLIMTLKQLYGSPNWVRGSASKRYLHSRMFFLLPLLYTWNVWNKYCGSLSCHSNSCFVNIGWGWFFDMYNLAWFPNKMTWNNYCSPHVMGQKPVCVQYTWVCVYVCVCKAVWFLCVCEGTNFKRLPQQHLQDHKDNGGQFWQMGVPWSEVVTKV